MNEIAAGRLSINRIRLEFKAFSAYTPQRSKTVLIESDWNLKGYESTD